MDKRISSTTTLMISAICLFVLACGGAWAASVEELTKQLQAALNEDVKALSKKDDKAKGQAGTQTGMGAEVAIQLQMLQQAVQSGAIFSLSEEQYGAGGGLEAIATIAPSEKTRKLAMELATQIKKSAQERETAWLHATENTLKTCLQRGFAAKTAKEIDPLLIEVGKIGRYSGGRYNRSGNVNTLIEETNAAKSFLRQWQDYLAATEAGNKRGASEALRNIISSNREDLSSFIPRSELLAKLNALQHAEGQEGTKARKEGFSVAAIVAQTKTLEDLPKAVEALRQEDRTSYSSNSESQLANELRSLERTYQDVKTGRGSTIRTILIEYSTRSLGSGTVDRIAALRSQLVRLALPMACGLETAEDLPKADEPLIAYLRRVMESAKQHQNWTSLANILEVAQPLSAGVSTTDTTAMKSFLGALNLEKARSYSLAVSKFHSAISTGSQLVPVDFIAARLESIKKDHPQEYEAGLKLAEKASEPYRPVVYPPNYTSGAVNDAGVPLSSFERMSNTMMRVMPPPAFSNWVQRMSNQPQRSRE